MSTTIFQFAKRIFFWVPMLLALTDLAFFVAVPILIASALGDSYENNWQEQLLDFGQALSLTIPELAFSLIASLAVIRALVIKFLGRVFSDSLSSAYAEVSSSFIDAFFNAVANIKILDLGRFRKVMNAETNNLFFGVLVSISFALAEILIVLAAIVILLVLLGSAALMVLAPAAACLVAVMLLMRKQARLIGRQRASSEQKRQESVEMLIDSGYSINVNDGAVSFSREFENTSIGFSEALGRQLVLPYYTKSLVDGILMLVLTVALILYSGAVETLNLAILMGVGLRCIPAMSRITAYVESVRISIIGARDALNLESDFRNSSVSMHESDPVMKFLTGIAVPGLFIIKGPSGTGKTSAVKKWILASENTSMAYFDQGGFSRNTHLEDLAGLLGTGDAAVFNKLDFMRDRENTKLSDLSGGQARYVQLFALLAKKVDCVVLDEPSVGLDAGLRAKLEDLIVDKSQIVPVVVISHDNEFISSLRGSGGQLFEV